MKRPLPILKADEAEIDKGRFIHKLPTIGRNLRMKRPLSISASSAFRIGLTRSGSVTSHTRFGPSANGMIGRCAVQPFSRKKPRGSRRKGARSENQCRIMDLDGLCESKKGR